METCRLSSSLSASSSSGCYRAAPQSSRASLGELRERRAPCRSRGDQLTRGRLVTVEAKKREERQDEGLRFERLGKSVRLSFRETEIQVPDQALFLSALALLGFGALIGPLIIGITVTVLSISVALSMGAFAISTLFFPFIIMFMLTFGFFTSVALLGFGVIAPKLIGLVAAGAGVAIVGVSVARMMLAQNGVTKVSGALNGKAAASPPVVEVDPEEEEAKRLSEELRDFDRQLADREYHRRMNQRKS